MTFSIHMDPNTLRQVESLAKKMGKTRNALVNIAVNEFVRNQSEREWPESVAQLLKAEGPAKIRNFVGFEAHRTDLGALRDVDL